MGPLTPPMCALIERYNAGCVASVNADGTPAVSPKATFVVVDRANLVFGNIRSPNTVANLRARPSTEINFVDVLTRRAVRVKGQAEIIDKDSIEGQRLQTIFEGPWGPYLSVIEQFVGIHVIQAELILSPAYDLGATAEELRDVNLAKLNSV